MWHVNKAKISMSHEFYIEASVICEFEYQHRNDLSLELYNLLIFTFFISKPQNFLKPCRQREVWSFSLYVQVMAKVLKYIGLINNIFLEFMCKQHQNPNQPPALPSLLPLCYPLQRFNNFASKEAAIDRMCRMCPVWHTYHKNIAQSVTGHYLAFPDNL